jgi:hypothetical protein
MQGTIFWMQWYARDYEGTDSQKPEAIHESSELYPLLKVPPIWPRIPLFKDKCFDDLSEALCSLPLISIRVVVDPEMKQYEEADKYIRVKRVGRWRWGRRVRRRHPWSTHSGIGDVIEFKRNNSFIWFLSRDYSCLTY